MRPASVRLEHHNAFAVHVNAVERPRGHVASASAERCDFLAKLRAGKAGRTAYEPVGRVFNSPGRTNLSGISRKTVDSESLGFPQHASGAFQERVGHRSRGR